MTSEPNNPYESPKNLEVSGQQMYRRPGPLAMFGIVVVSLIAGGCTFFGTCFGIGLGLFSVRANEGVLIVGAYGGGTVLGLFVGWGVYRLMTRRKFYGRHSSEESSQA
ncbi:MAG TPA: hypothetical protein EYG03_13280 [Planctomycetes bacterium]|nr:hypothetical protein [Fuerstiella sp.]HIK92934.1 hypothetical protein [Planctomycetota bacterium]